MLDAAKLGEEGPAQTVEVAEAFSSGAASIAQYGGAAEGNRTMLDALLPASRAFTEAATKGTDQNFRTA